MFYIMVCVVFCARFLLVWVSHSIKKLKEGVIIITTLFVIDIFLHIAPYLVLIMMLRLEMLTLSPPQVLILAGCDILSLKLKQLMTKD